MRALLLLFVLPLVSCMGMRERTTRNLTDNTITEDKQAYAFGGKFAGKWGEGFFWNGEKSFQDGALAAAAIGTSGFSAAATEAQEVTKQVLDTNAATTSQKATAEAAAVEVVKSNNATKVLLAPPE
jgi:hypothetical protein